MKRKSIKKIIAVLLVAVTSLSVVGCNVEEMGGELIDKLQESEEKEIVTKAYQDKNRTIEITAEEKLLDRTSIEKELDLALAKADGAYEINVMYVEKVGDYEGITRQFFLDNISILFEDDATLDNSTEPQEIEIAGLQGSYFEVSITYQGTQLITCVLLLENDNVFYTITGSIESSQSIRYKERVEKYMKSFRML